MLQVFLFFTLNAGFVGSNQPHAEIRVYGNSKPPPELRGDEVNVGVCGVEGA